METSCIVLAAALQRYVDAPPVAVKQRALCELLAKKNNARVYVISVEAPVSLAPGAEPLEKKLEAYVAPLKEAGVTIDEITAEKGKPHTVLPRYVKDVGADLLIIGSHSKRSPTEITIGGTATDLMRDVEAGVLLVKPNTAEYAKTKEMMIPSYPWTFPYLS
jgi:nucleotide-binding universal stress UspA family protein